MAVERGFAVVRHRPSWYGFDPIHIKHRHRSAAWNEILSDWSLSSQAGAAARGTVAQTLYLRSRMPEKRRFLGFEQRGRQPAARLRDGTTVAIY